MPVARAKDSGCLAFFLAQLGCRLPGRKPQAVLMSALDFLAADGSAGEAERTAARRPFRPGSKEKEESREKTGRGQGGSLGRETFAEAERNQAMREEKPPSSSSLAQEGPTSLPSKTRSKEAGHGRERLRVSFAEGSSSSPSSPSLVGLHRGEKGTRWALRALGQNDSSTRSLRLEAPGEMEPHRPARDSWREAYRSQCCPPSGQPRELAKELQNARGAAKEAWRGPPASPEGFRTAAASSSWGDFLRHPWDADQDSGHSWKLSLASSSIGEFPLKHHPPPPSPLLPHEMLLENSQSTSALASASRKGPDSPPYRPLSPSRVNWNNPSGQCASGRLKGPLQEPSLKPPPREQSSGHHHPWADDGPASTNKASLVLLVLRQLLELVDRYWDGPGSLLLKKDFLAAARCLLTPLMAAAPSQPEAPTARRADPGPEAAEAGPMSCRKNSKYSHLFNGTDKMALGGGQGMPPKDPSTDAVASSDCGPRGMYSPSYDELMRSNEKLSAQVDNLTFELKQLQKQQETISLLQESHRSLVSTNNFLLQQLRKQHGPPPDATAPKAATPGRAVSFERTSSSGSSFSLSALGCHQPCGS